MVHTKDIFAVVVLYNCSLADSLTIQTINKELEIIDDYLDVMIYDNSPYSSETRQNLTYRRLNIFYFNDILNSGLSKAYNFGAKKADELRKPWLLLLDQDTTLPSGIFRDYFEAIQSQPEIKLFAPILKLNNGVIFSPCINRHKRGYPVKNISTGIHYLRKFTIVNSGMLISVALFKETGGYNELLKVDFCDFQFLEKVQTIESVFFLTKSIALQEFSNDEVSSEKQLRRFEIYLADAKNSEKHTFSDKIGFFYTVTRHTIGLTLKARKISFVRLYILKYLMR
jgi:glycosyltransferase involved in cell wall biosynthesis